MSDQQDYSGGYPSGRRRRKKENSYESKRYPSGQVSERKEKKSRNSTKGHRVGKGSVKKTIYAPTSIEGSRNNWNMEGLTYTSWSDDDFDTNSLGTGVFHPNIDLIDSLGTESDLPPADILPDDLQERILASLPLVDLFKASCVCKKWNQIVRSEKFTLNDGSALSQKPWYFMFTSSDEQLGYLYDSGQRKWYNFELPFVVQHTWFIAPSRGLVCFMDEEGRPDMYVCNPITKECITIEKPSGPGFAVYTALAFSVNQSKCDYTVAIVRSMQASEDFLLWDIAIHLYHSEKKKWALPLMQTMAGWRAGDVSVICNGVLYILVFSTRSNETQIGHGLITYNLHSGAQSVITADNPSIYVPCYLTCGRLMNVQNKLVLVGGIGRSNRPGLITGIGIWVLLGTEWEQISRMPSNFVPGFGEFDEVFASSGGGDLVYIQSYGATALLVFNMTSKEWSWSRKCPMVKKFPLQIFSGFCFEPNTKIIP